MQYMGMTEALLATTARLAIVNLRVVKTSCVIFCKHIYQIKSLSLWRLLERRLRYYFPRYLVAPLETANAGHALR